MPISNVTWQGLVNAHLNGSGWLEKNAGADTCYEDAFGTGDGGAYSVNTIASTDDDWALTWTLGPDPCGRTFVGLDYIYPFSLDFGDWYYCLAISTVNNTVDPHPPDSVFVYDGTPPPKTAYREGIWNEGEVLSIICKSNVVRYYIGTLCLYVSPRAPIYPLYVTASLGCLGKYVENPRIQTGPGVNVGSNLIATLGAQTGESCAAAWTPPSPSSFPLPSNGGPQYAYFDEMEPDWGGFSSKFSDGSERFNTIQTVPTRRFVIEWDSLTAAQAASLDAHWESTRGGLSFTFVHPRTAEVITGVRYSKYSRNPHRVSWIQNRSAELMRYPA